MFAYLECNRPGSFVKDVLFMPSVEVVENEKDDDGDWIADQYCHGNNMCWVSVELGNGRSA